MNSGTYTISGVISFVASRLEKARQIILQDPFVLEDLIAEKWIKE
jgi:hypothetical protein